jgi:hypothetical protein
MLNPSFKSRRPAGWSMVAAFTAILTVAAASSTLASPGPIPAKEFPRIVQLIKSGDPINQADGLYDLGVMISPGDEKLVALIPDVIVLTNSPNEIVRMSAVGALEKLAFHKGADKHDATLVKVWGRAAIRGPHESIYV